MGYDVSKLWELSLAALELVILWWNFIILVFISNTPRNHDISYPKYRKFLRNVQRNMFDPEFLFMALSHQADFQIFFFFLFAFRTVIKESFVYSLFIVLSGKTRSHKSSQLHSRYRSLCRLSRNREFYKIEQIVRLTWQVQLLVL